MPEFKVVFRGLFFSKGGKKDWPSDENSYYLYSRGMWALNSAIQALLAYKDRRKGTVWFPDYFCNEALLPIRQLPIRIDFYPICKNLEPNWEVLEKNVRDSNLPDIFILVHYFGFQNNSEKARKFCDRYAINLIEDGAYVASSTCDIGRCGDAVIYKSEENIRPG